MLSNLSPRSGASNQNLRSAAHQQLVKFTTGAAHSSGTSVRKPEFPGFPDHQHSGTAFEYY